MRHHNGLIFTISYLQNRTFNGSDFRSYYLGETRAVVIYPMRIRFYSFSKQMLRFVRWKIHQFSQCPLQTKTMYPYFFCGVSSRRTMFYSKHCFPQPYSDECNCRGYEITDIQMRYLPSPQLSLQRCVKYWKNHPTQYSRGSEMLSVIFSDTKLRNIRKSHV